jgi:hypothetical protein
MAYEITLENGTSWSRHKPAASWSKHWFSSTIFWKTRSFIVAAPRFPKKTEEGRNS